MFTLKIRSAKPGMRIASFIGAALLAVAACLLLAAAIEPHVSATSGNNLFQSVTLPVPKAANALTALAPAPVPTATPTFSRVGALTLNAGEFALRSAVIDPAGGFAYFGTFSSPAMMVKVRLSYSNPFDALTLKACYAGPYEAGAD